MITPEDPLMFVLSRAEYQELIFALGAAAGLAGQSKNDDWRERIISLINRVCADDPDFRPYVMQAKKSEE